MRKFLSVALLFSVVTFLGCQKETAKVESSSKVSSASRESNGLKAYDFSFTDVNGKKHKLSDFKGKVVVLQFFGTYCPPCRAEMPVLDEIYKKYNGKVVVIGLSVDYSGRSPQELKPFVEEMGVSYIVAPAPEKAWDEFAGKITGLDSIPQTYIIDKKGFVRYYEVGFTPSYRELFKKAIDKLLAEE